MVLGKCCKNALCNHAGDENGHCYCGAPCKDCAYKPKPTKEDVLDFIDGMRAVTPGELIMRYGKGTHDILHGNVYVAFGLTEELVATMLELMRENKVILSPCGLGVLDWVSTGSPMPMKMPMAKGKNWDKYKTERWYPCEFLTKKWFIKRINSVVKSKKDRDQILRNIGGA